MPGFVNNIVEYYTENSYKFRKGKVLAEYIGTKYLRKGEVVSITYLLIAHEDGTTSRVSAEMVNVVANQSWVFNKEV